MNPSFNIVPKTEPERKAFLSGSCQLALLHGNRKEFTGSGYARLNVLPKEWCLCNDGVHDFENRVELAFPLAPADWGEMVYVKVIAFSGREITIPVVRNFIYAGTTVAFYPGDVRVSGDLI